MADGEGAILPVATNMCGVAVEWPIATAGLTPQSVTVKGQPKGLSYSAARKAVTGVPTAAEKSGTMTVTVKSSGGSRSWKIPWRTIALPEWARGGFTGVAALPAVADGEPAAATMSVGSAGKISGKFALGGTNWTFSASSFAADSVVTGGTTRLVARMAAKGTWKAKSGKTTVTKSVTAPLGFALVADPETSAIAAVSEDGTFGAATEYADAGEMAFSRNAGVRVAKAGATSGGTVSLSAALGQAAEGKTVKATAKLAKGYAFVGWYETDGTCRVEGGTVVDEHGEAMEPKSLSLSCSVTMDGSDRFLAAAFAKESDLPRPVLALDDGLDAFASSDSGGIVSTNLLRGVSYPAMLKTSGAAAVKIAKVTGLPAGLKHSAGKITGVPTSAKAYAATVTVALSTNAKKTWTYRPTFVVGALPEWLVGTYCGGGDDSYATFTVQSTGKTSGKALFAGDTWTFAASSLTRTEDGFRAKTTRTDAKKRKATVYLDFREGADGRGAVEDADGRFAAEKSVWASGDAWKDFAAEVEGRVLEDGDLGEILDASGADARSETAPLKVSVSADGWATVADGARSAKAQMRPVSAEVDPATGAILSAEVELRVVLPATSKSPKRPAAFRLIRFGLQAE